MLRLWVGFGMMFAATVASHGGQAQSFNCAKARAADEIVICKDSELSRLDDQMSALYFSVRDRSPGPVRAELEAGQADWIASRRVCGRDQRCIRAAYMVRIAELMSR